MIPHDDIAAFLAGRLNGIFSATVFLYILASLYWRRLADGFSISRPVQLLLAVSFSVVAVIGFWYSGQSTDSAIGGVVPIMDAKGYYDCALGLLEERPLNLWCTRRPLYTGMLSGWLFLTDKNIQLVIVLQSVLAGIVSWLVADSVRKAFGWRVALVTFAVIMQFSITHVISTLSENAGILLGGMAAVFIFRAAQSRNTVDWFAGLLLLTLALNARSGVYFMLPALLMFAYFYTDGNKRIMFISTGIIAIAVGFMAPWLILLITGSEAGNVNSNFSYTFYGLAAGGKKWTQVYTDHPEIFNKGLSEIDKAKEIYRVSFEMFFNQPWLLAKAYLNGFWQFIEKVFKFFVYLPLRIAAIVSWLAGLWMLWRRRESPVFGMLLLAMVGVLLSAPIIIYDAGYRVFAPAMALMAVVAGIGVDGLYKIISTKNIRTIVEINESATFARPIFSSFVATMIVVIMMLSPLLGSSANRTNAIAGTCKQDEIAFRTDYSKTASISITNQGEWRLYPLSIPENRFKRDLGRFTPYIKMFKSLPPNTSIMAARNNIHNSSFVMLFDNELSLQKKNDVICAKKSDHYPQGFLIFK